MLCLAHEVEDSEKRASWRHCLMSLLQPGGPHDDVHRVSPRGAWQELGLAPFEVRSVLSPSQKVGGNGHLPIGWRKWVGDLEMRQGGDEP